MMPKDPMPTLKSWEKLKRLASIQALKETTI